MEDWGQLVSFTPDVVLEPTSVDELKRTLEEVHADGGRVRVPGSLHSCSGIVVSDAILDTSALPRSIVLDDGDETVVVSANTTLRELLARLAEHGRSATATGGVDHQTLAGLISTGTAPASSRHALWEALDWVEVVSVDPATATRTSGASPGATSTSPRSSARSGCSASSRGCGCARSRSATSTRC